MVDAKLEVSRQTAHLQVTMHGCPRNIDIASLSLHTVAYRWLIAIHRKKVIVTSVCKSDTVRHDIITANCHPLTASHFESESVWRTA